MPLILVTNDDGISSPGLRAAVRAAVPLGEVVVAAPARQWSGAGRSMLLGPTISVVRSTVEVGDGRAVTAYQVDASPATAVMYVAFKLVPRPPALIVSGINYGENLGSDVTVSGTVGAAIQGATMGIPSLAVSLQTPRETHANPSNDVDFSAATHFTRLLARRMLQVELPFDVDVLKVDIPAGATPETPWRLTRVSRQPYFVAIPPPGRRPPASDGTSRSNSADPTPPAEPDSLNIDYESLPHPERTERDSDIYALAVDRVVSVAPLSVDVSSRTDLWEMESLLRGRTMR